MSEERTIEGVIEVWAKEPKEIKKDKFYTNGLKIDGNWHNIPSYTIEDIEALKETTPKGTRIRFIEEFNDPYWNFKKGSLKVLEDELEPQPVDNKPTNNTGPKPISNSTEREVREIRGKCLMYARAEEGIMNVNKLIERAKELEQFVWSGMTHPINPLKSSDEGIKITEEEVK